MPTRPVDESTHTVEERFRVAFVYLKTLKQVAAMVDEIDSPAPGFETRQDFAKWVMSMADAMGSQVGIIEATLPADCLSVVAPLIIKPSVRY